MVNILPDAIYTVSEVAEILRCGKSNVYNLLNGQHMAVTRIGAGSRGLMVGGSDFLAFLESRKTGGPSPKMSFKRLKI